MGNYMDEPNNGMILLDLTKAFDNVDRETLWTAMYRKGIPKKYIEQIIKAHENTKLCAKRNKMYGEKNRK